MFSYKVTFRSFKNRLIAHFSHMKKNRLLIVFLGSLLIAISFAGYLYSIYTTAFSSNLAVAATKAEWGVMGDFFGGILNPIFSFLGLVMLLVTLLQNQTELELSRDELIKSTKALAEQAQTLEKQRFEDTFFALLDQLNRLLERLLSEGVRHDPFTRNPSTVSSTVESLSTQLIGDGIHLGAEYDFSLPDAKKVLLAHDPSLNQYFRILYQVLKFIATNSPDAALHGTFVTANIESTNSSATEKFYSNLVRSFVPENIYYLLAVNCFAKDSEDSYYPYKLLIERYEFLEHMPLNIPEYQNRSLVTQIISHYKATAFGSNPEYGRRS